MVNDRVFQSLTRMTLVAITALLLLCAKLAGAQQPSIRRVAVATHAIARGAVLTAADIEYPVQRQGDRPGDDTKQVAPGWVTRRVIAAGEVFRAPAVEAPSVVTANSPVQIEWRDQNVSLTLRGTATRNGSVGERVGVRTEQGRRMEATVVAPGRVRID